MTWTSAPKLIEAIDKAMIAIYIDTHRGCKKIYLGRKETEALNTHIATAPTAAKTRFGTKGTRTTYRGAEIFTTDTDNHLQCT